MRLIMSASNIGIEYTLSVGVKRIAVKIKLRSIIYRRFYEYCTGVIRIVLQDADSSETKRDFTLLSRHVVLDHLSNRTLVLLLLHAACIGM